MNEKNVFDLVLDSVYLLKAEDGKYKIGFSKNPIKRLSQLQTANPNNLMVVDIYKSSNANKIEKILHRQFKSRRINGEWFNLAIEDEFNFSEYCKIIDESIKKLKIMGNVFI